MAKKSKKPKAKDNKAADVEKKKSRPVQVIPPQQRMSDMQAIQFIDGCVAQAPLGRMVHVQAQAALRQISGALGELERLKKVPKEGD